MTEMENEKVMAKNDITNEKERLETQAAKESLETIKAYLTNRLKNNKSVSELEEMDESYTSVYEEKYDYSSVEKDLEASKSKRKQNLRKNVISLKSGGIGFKALINGYMADSDEIRDRKDTLDFAKKDVDFDASNQVINNVKKEYINNIFKIKDEIDVLILNLWRKKYIHTLEKLKEIIQADKDTVIESLKEVKEKDLFLDDAANDIFVKDHFLRWDSQKLNKKRIVEIYSKNLTKKVKEYALQLNNLYMEEYNSRLAEAAYDIEENMEAYSAYYTDFRNRINESIEAAENASQDKKTVDILLDEIEKLTEWKGIYG